MALDRTWLAHERTLMAWVRTAASMISFAFSVYKFFQFAEDQKKLTPGFFSPRAFAIFLCGVGLVSLLLAVINREREVRQLRIQLEQRHFSPATLVATLIFIFGLGVLVSAALRQ
jgi:putative membrane protein